MEALVAAVDFDRLGIRASGGGLLACADAYGGFGVCRKFGELCACAESGDVRVVTYREFVSAPDVAERIGAGDCGAEF